jgi:general secretion pathway protein K
MRRPVRRKERGVALIVALLILAIATGLASAMIVRNQNAFEVTAALENGARADAVASSAFILAEALLDQDDRHVDGPTDTWAQPMQVPTGGATVSLHIVDMQGRFNLNDLITADDKVNVVAKARFQKLLGVLKIDTDISNAVIDWIDANQTIEPGGGEDGTYQQGGRGTIPSLPAGRPMISVTELRGVSGVTEAIYQRLAPFVSALPVGTPINLNSAPPEILQALGARITPSTTTGTTKATPKSFGSVADFLAQPEFAGTVVPPDGLAVNSQYFLCVVTIHMGNVTRHRYAMIQRLASGPSRLIALSNEACLTGLSCL